MGSEKKKRKALLRNSFIFLIVLLIPAWFIISVVRNYFAYVEQYNAPPKIAENLMTEGEALLEKAFQIMLPPDMYISKAYYDRERLIIRIGSTDSISGILHEVIGLGYDEAKKEERSILSSIAQKSEIMYCNADNEWVYSAGLKPIDYNDNSNPIAEIEFYYNENNTIVTEISTFYIDHEYSDEVYNIFKKREEVK